MLLPHFYPQNNKDMRRIENILNYKRKSNILSTSGQPKEDEIILIKNEGFDVILNIRPEQEMFYEFNEKEIVEKFGMKYFQIPMTFETLNKEILEKFFKALEEYKDEKLFVHCHHNIRVSALLAFYRIIKLGWEKEEAYTELAEMMEVNSMLENFFNFHINNYSV